MDDRDKDLTHLFVRDLDEIALPDRGAWRPQARKERLMTRTSRYFLNTAAVAAVLILALVVAYQLQQRQEVAGPPASASPSASSSGLPTPSQNTGLATATPGASTAPSSVYNDDFGFVVFSQASQGAAIRTESGAVRPGTLAAVPPGLAVSPDGKLAAYWTSSTTPSQLRMFTTLGNATEQTLVTLPAGTRGGGVAWASDGAALLYSTETGSFGIGGGTNSATLDTFELAGPPLRHATIDTQTNTGFLYRPIAWDRSANLAAAGLTGEGGFMGAYVTVRTDQSNAVAQRTDTRTSGIGMGSVHPSTDGKLVLGIAGTQVKYWPIADYAANKMASGNGLFGAQWQPGTHKIGFMSGDGFVLFNADDSSAATPFRGVKAGMAVRTFRADGSAVVLGLPKGGGSDVTEHTLIRLTDGASVTFEVIGTLTASVRLR